ncbi:hypothetical protein CHS0354_033796 [Potamilus streckersoni]|uniref:C2H2-type domain-containing protein n=1 Tax=Potamilus streckersoni TaxID=2493646 RepID=A0AAE0SFQ9_9BIVA|nr:hypothetical protein CHS0354_033796 [Potamilus streckersoni]
MDVDNVLLKPEHRIIVQAVLKYEIQGLLKKLSESGVETVVLTASTEEENCWYLGSQKGTDFVSHVRLDWVRKEFLNFCANSENSYKCTEENIPQFKRNSFFRSSKRRSQKAGRIRNSCIPPESTTTHLNAENCLNEIAEHNRRLGIDFETPAKNILIPYDKFEGEVIMTRDQLVENDLKTKHSVPTYGGTLSDSERNIYVNIESLDEVGKPKAVEEEMPYNQHHLKKAEDQNDLKIFHNHDRDTGREVQSEIRFSKNINHMDHDIGISTYTTTESCHSDPQFCIGHRNDSLPVDKNDIFLDITKIGDYCIENEEASNGQKIKIKSEPEDSDLEPELELHSESTFKAVNAGNIISDHQSSIANSIEVSVQNPSNSIINNLEDLVKVHTAVSVEADRVQNMLQIPWLSRKGLVHDISHPTCYKTSRRMIRKNLGISVNSVNSDDLLCSECGKTFNQAGSMLRHKMRKHFPGSFECSVCARKFAYKSDLDKHFRTHSGEKPYPCSVCGKAFADSGNKRKHEARCKIRMKKKFSILKK